MEQAERDRSLGHRRLDGAFAGDAETTSAALLKFPLQPARSSELTISYRFGLLSLDCGRIVPALRDPQPVLRQPQQGRTHRLVLSAVCGVKTCSCTTPIFLAPTRHNEDPRSMSQNASAPAGLSGGERGRKMAPRGATGRGQVRRSSNAQGSTPRALFQRASVKLVPAHRLNSAS